MFAKLIESAPIIGNLLDFGTLAALALIFLCVAILLPKSAVLRKIEHILIMLGSVSVIAASYVTVKMSGKGTFVLENCFASYVLLAFAVVLLWGLFFRGAYLTQTLYGLFSCIGIPFGLWGMLVPTWMKADTFVEFIHTPSDIIRFLIYAGLFFIPIWLIGSGTYRLRLGSVWNLIVGMCIFGVVGQFVVEAKIASSSAALKLISIFDENGLNLENVKYFGIISGIAIVVILIAGLISTLVRHEKVAASETASAMVLRVVGNILSAAVCLASILLLPYLMNATTKETLIGLPKAVIFLAPVAVVVIISLITAFLAERNEIKVAVAAYEAAYPAPVEEAVEATEEAPAEEAVEATEEAPAEDAVEATEEAPAEETVVAAEEAPAEEAAEEPRTEETNNA